MKFLPILLALVVGGAWAQEKIDRKKMDKKKAAVAHKKATPEQIRKFNDLEKKQQK